MEKICVYPLIYNRSIQCALHMFFAYTAFVHIRVLRSLFCFCFHFLFSRSVYFQKSHYFFNIRTIFLF